MDAYVGSEWGTLTDLADTIEAGYHSLGYKALGDLGYRFLSSPESTLYADRMIISINPAGNRPDVENDSMFTPEGVSAYVHERWLAAPMGSSKLQRQYQAMFDYLGWDPLSVLQAPFSPYRYPSWSNLPSAVRSETAEFCSEVIWKPFFKRHCPAEIVCVGKPQLEPLLEAIASPVISETTVETGWHNKACDSATTFWLETGTTVVQIPHLSRFGIMTAPCCRAHLPEIFWALRESSRVAEK